MSTNIPVIIALEIITPTSIGDGNTLSPFSDFVIISEDKTIVIIDHFFFNEELRKKPELIDGFTSEMFEIQANSQKNSNFSIKKIEFLNNFITNKLKCKIKNVLKAKYSLFAPTNKIENLQTITKNAFGKPYIPGSSIKGAVKSALLYDWLIASNENYEQRFNNPFNDNSFKRDFSLIQFTDSKSFTDDAIGVYLVERLRIKNSEQNSDRKLSQFQESIQPGYSSIFTFKLPDNPIDKIENVSLGLNGEKPVEVLFQKINQFSLAGIEYEIKQLDDNNVKRLKDFRKYIEYLRNRIIDAQKTTNTAYIRLGNSKMSLYNSIGLAIYKKEEDNFVDYIKKNFRGNIDYNVFPKTRAVETSEFMPLGWVKLTIK